MRECGIRPDLAKRFSNSCEGHCMPSSPFQLVSVQTGKARKVHIQGRPILTAIHKSHVVGAVKVERLGLAGDEQADLSVHGGLDKAVYAFPTEHYPFWQHARLEAGVVGLEDPTLPWGAMGENLSLRGVLEAELWVGDTLHFEHCVLRVTQAREPCFKFNAAMGFSQATKMMAQSGTCGFYLAVDQAGSLQAGEGFEIQPGPRSIRVSESFRTKMFKHLR
jgi:MOSC domain-containing protein YiiM